MLTIFIALLTGIVAGWLLKGMLKIGLLAVTVLGVFYFGGRYINVNWNALIDDGQRVATSQRHVAGVRESTKRWM